MIIYPHPPIWKEFSKRAENINKPIDELTRLFLQEQNKYNYHMLILSMPTHMPTKSARNIVEFENSYIENDYLDPEYLE